MHDTEQAAGVVSASSPRLTGLTSMASSDLCCWIAHTAQARLSTTYPPVLSCSTDSGEGVSAARRVSASRSS